MKRISKILGIVLVLAMLAGMMIVATPATAGDLYWEQVSVPAGTTTKSLFSTAPSSISLFTFTPDGQTAFAVNSMAATNGGLLKSGNGGVSWSGANLGGNALAAVSGAAIVDIAISPNYATDTTILVATSTTLYRSRNGGASFLVVTGPTVGGITCIDIAPYYIPSGGTALLVAGMTDVQLYDDDNSWRSVVNTSQMGGAGINILASQFSPNYQNDAEILAVVANAQLAGMTAPGTVLETKFATADWNATVRAARLNNPSTATVPGAITTATWASLAFPSDYDSSSGTMSRVYVGLGDATIGGYDVFRVNGTIGLGNPIIATALNLVTSLPESNTSSLAYNGTVASGTLVVGQVAGGVWTATTPNATAAWTGAANGPTGTYVIVKFPAGSTTLFAASANLVSPANFGSAISTSTDYSIFKQISLISVPNLAGLTMSNWKRALGTSLDQFILLKDTTNNISILFKSTDAGETWAEIARSTATNQFASINPSPSYATDNTVFIQTSGAVISKSTDGGSSYISLAATIPSGSTVSAFTAIDANSYWLGANTGGIYKSGSYVQIAAIGGETAVAIIPLPFGIVAVTTAGNFWVSTDNGATFAKQGVPGFTGVPAFTFDVPGKTIYAAQNGGTSIMKWTVGTSTAWTLQTAVAVTGTTVAIGALNLAPDNTLYVINNVLDADLASYQILRCVTFTAAGPKTFEGLKGTTKAAADFSNTGNLGGTAIVYNATGYAYNLIYQIVLNAPTAINGHANQIKKFTDTMIAGPKISAPAADAQVAEAFNIAWGAVPAGTNPVTYAIQMATDAGFANMVVNATTTATSYFVGPATGLVQGFTYYIRVKATVPYLTPNSTTTKIVVKLAQTGNTDLTKNMSPAPGAVDVPVNATFQWSAVVGADTYHIQVADNPSFTDPLADATTKDTFFTMSSPLMAGTVYYWRVQAVSGQIASDYVSRVFTTAAPVAPPTATTTQPPQTVQPTIIVTIPPSTPAPVSTPAYIWAIIAIGAVLVIAVIVLIARTRRV